MNILLNVRQWSLCSVFLVLACAHYPLIAQTAPAEGLRKNTPNVHAFVNARIVQSPGNVIESGTLIIRDGIVEAVGTVSPPADARVRDVKGMTIYPGFIDGDSDYGMPKPPAPGQEEKKTEEPRGLRHWNMFVNAHQRADKLFAPDPKAAEKLRGQGFTAALVAPTRGIFRGTSALVSLGEGTANELVIQPGIAHHISFDRGPGEGYPSSLMGIIALIRQTIIDAGWYKSAREAYRKNLALPRPEPDEALAALEGILDGRIPVIFETTDEQSLLRADRIGKEFSLNMILRGSGHEYKRLDAVKATQRHIILPVNFPDPPSVQTPEEALQVSLTELRYWDEAPENPLRLSRADVPFSLATSRLKDPEKFLAQLRTAVERGLPSRTALAALTTVPAKLCGVDAQLGSLERGKIANFLITDGDIFKEKTNIREVWVDGKQYEVKSIPAIDPRGKWQVKIHGKSDSLTLALKGDPGALQGTISKERETKLRNATFSTLRLMMSFPGDSLGYAGIVRMTGTVEADAIAGNGEWSDGSPFVWSAIRTGGFTPEPDTTKPKPPAMASFPPNYPHGEYGRERIPDQPAVVVVKGATLWTSGPQGIIEQGDMLVQKGKITNVGRNLPVPSGALVIDATGKHVTAGLIDAHSHMAGSGGLNEAAQAVSAEVRIGDVIDANDIDLYRALAGGLTAAHILHGSANPIGGQSQLIKLRWGMPPEDLKFEGAFPTIKFALGENVKQSNWGDAYTTRYPQTRMGVEQIIRDEFKAALDYERAWQRYQSDKTGIPPRRDLELDAILEILRNKRDIHCHSYRQDEILMLMRLGEDVGFRVHTFQHILEGYKVADVMAQHGAGGSSFSDWWGYKLEVYDAIPHNGALMHEQGVLVSFNSDSDEMARRMNTEAAKAVKYGGVSEEEALKFVTYNPAKQLRVEHRVGSLEAGKDADFVVWSGHPLSTYTTCEQTWIDGRRYFDIKEDLDLRKQVEQQRATLIQKALETKKTGGGEPPKPESKQGDTFDHPHPYSCVKEVH